MTIAAMTLLRVVAVRRCYHYYQCLLNEGGMPDAHSVVVVVVVVVLSVLIQKSLSMLLVLGR